jgi:hypothetical protein
MGVTLSKDGVELSQIVATHAGILVNKHAYELCDRFAFGGKDHPKTVVAQEKVSGNADLILCKAYNGTPKALTKAHFEIPKADIEVILLCAKGKQSTGNVVCASEQGAFGTQMRSTCSSEKGDCGGAYVNTNGCVVGIHFSEGDKKKTNLAIPVTESLLELISKN